MYIDIFIGPVGALDEGENSLSIQHIHAFLVHPKKSSEEASSINGSAVALSGKLFELLREVYTKADLECDIDITFTSNNGSQQNDCRDLICKYTVTPTLPHGKMIAERLERHTDRRSGLGLLFLMSGKEGRDHKVVLSRFPTDNAIYVDENPRSLTVKFLERVFMKNKASYKAVIYQNSSLHSGFWTGRAIDRQINSAAGETSNYWIIDFLASEFTLTAAAGTRRLANAIRSAVKKVALPVKEEIIAAAKLAQGLRGQRISIDEFADRFALSDPARAAIGSELRNPRMAQERFQFELSVFQSLVGFKSIELSNGGTLTAPSDQFDSVFRKERLHQSRDEFRFVTEGRVVNEKLKTTA